MRVSVVICTWNRAALLDQALREMRKLAIPRGVWWELLVVDNNSTDNTSDVIAAHSALLPIRSLFEPGFGKSFAANRAISEVTGDLILWTDDDVLVSPNWMQEYVSAAQAWPEAAFFGGTVDPWFESKPPSWIYTHLVIRGPYAVNQLGPEVRPFKDGESPHGANMAIRTSVARRFQFNVDLGRFQNTYLPGEDGELVSRLRRAGHTGVWVGTAVVRHYISANRLTRRYIWNWYLGHGKTLVIREKKQIGRSMCGVPLWAIRAYVESRLKSWILLPLRGEGWVRAYITAARMRGIIEECLARLRDPSSRSTPAVLRFLSKPYLPWRVKRAFDRSSYIQPLTRHVFRGVLQTPPLAADGDSVLDVLSLLDQSNVANYLLAIKSLLMHLPTRVAVTVLSDGTLRPCDIDVLKRHVFGIRVLIKEQIPLPSCSSTVIDHWCKEYRYLAKLMYLPFATEKPRIMILDSDVIFRGPLPASLLQLPAGIAATFNRDHDHSRYDPCFHYLQEYAEARGISLIKDLNCGLMVWERTQVHPLDTIEFLEYVVQHHGFLHPVAEQDAWTLLASQLPAEPLPLDFLVLSNWEYNNCKNRRRALSIHYVRGERYRRLDYLKDGWRTMRLVERASSFERLRHCAEVCTQVPALEQTRKPRAQR